MKYISSKLVNNALFNLDSMRVKLLNAQYDAFYGDPKKYDELSDRIDEIESLTDKIYAGKMSKSDWDKVQSIVNEREALRYLNA